MTPVATPRLPVLAIVWHSRTGTARALARAAHDAALGCGERVDVRLLAAETVTAADLAAADGYLFACPENLASMSGAMKEMVDRCYYPLLGRIAGRPYALVIAAGTDGSGAVRQWQRIAMGWRLKPAAEPLIALTGADTPEAIAAPKSPDAASVMAARDLGAALATGLALGIF